MAGFLGTCGVLLPPFSFCGGQNDSSNLTPAGDFELPGGCFFLSDSFFCVFLMLAFCGDQKNRRKPMDDVRGCIPNGMDSGDPLQTIQVRHVNALTRHQVLTIYRHRHRGTIYWY